MLLLLLSAASVTFDDVIRGVMFSATKPLLFLCHHEWMSFTRSFTRVFGVNTHVTVNTRDYEQNAIVVFCSENSQKL